MEKKRKQILDTYEEDMKFQIKNGPSKFKIWVQNIGGSSVISREDASGDINKNGKATPTQSQCGKQSLLQQSL